MTENTFNIRHESNPPESGSRRISVVTFYFPTYPRGGTYEINSDVALSGALLFDCRFSLCSRYDFRNVDRRVGAQFIRTQSSRGRIKVRRESRDRYHRSQLWSCNDLEGYLQ